MCPAQLVPEAWLGWPRAEERQTYKRKLGSGGLCFLMKGTCRTLETQLVYYGPQGGASQSAEAVWLAVSSRRKLAFAHTGQSSINTHTWTGGRLSQASEAHSRKLGHSHGSAALRSCYGCIYINSIHLLRLHLRPTSVLKNKTKNFCLISNEQHVTVFVNGDIWGNSSKTQALISGSCLGIVCCVV